MLKKYSALKFVLYSLSVSMFMSGCGGGSSDRETPTPPTESIPLVGVFLASPEGLRYETESQKGVTNSQGEFSYKAGEQVSFYIGSSMLGSTIGAAIVTPFDLQSGSEPITNPIELIDAINGDPSPFTKVINILRLLQSVDDDQNPKNGIRISDDAVYALRNHMPDYSLSIEGFGKSIAVRKVFEYLNANSDDSSDIDLFSAFAVISHAYKSMGIDKLVYKNGRTASRPLRIERDHDADGDVDSVVTFEYDQYGNLVKEASDNNADGYEEWSIVREYHSSGSLKSIKYINAPRYGTREISYSNPDWNDFWEIGEQISDPWGNYYHLPLYATLSTQTNGLERRAEYDGGNDGVINRISIETLNEFGNVLRSEYDADGDGEADRTRVNIYDDQGRRISMKEYSDGVLYYVQTTEFDDINNTKIDTKNHGSRETEKVYYDSLERVVKEQSIIHNTNNSNSFERFYDESGNLKKIIYYKGLYENVRTIINFTYESGLLIKKTYEQYVSGYGDSDAYTYNDSGWLIHSSSQDAYLNISLMSYYSYDELGNVRVFREDGDGDGQMDYQETVLWESTFTPYPSQGFRSKWNSGGCLIELFTIKKYMPHCYR
ncbi:hypothetical protein [Neptunomonas sp. XY-337]|uniref:hypothetical protein n=1 Tax=Neptunomonas sp. XY-337 TaxID=2561897 RepID=UPI0010AAA59A|nr:hypothetical protein [Neptunomonas sp. XY-337]